MEKGKIGFATLMVLITACLFASASFAGTVEIKEMQFSFTSLPYYSNQTLGFSNQATSLVADVAIPTGPSTVDWAYSIQNAVVSLSGMPLVSGVNTSSGTFGGPATLTVTGSLISSSGALTANTTLLIAQMDSATFMMQQAFPGFASGLGMFTTTGGALFGGVDDGSNKVVLKGFEMGLWGSGTSVLFGASNSMTPDTAGIQITTDAIPEPATLGLMVGVGGGMLFLRRRRQNLMD